MRLVREHSRLAIVLGVCVLAAAGAITGVVVAGSGSSESALPTTGEYAPIKVSRQVVPVVGGGVSRELDAGVSTNLATQLTTLPGRHHYGITITNTSNLGYIDSFQWYPPMGVRVVKVTGSDAGRCGLTGLTGFGGNQFNVVLYPNIVCSRAHLKPPSCTCLNDGGSATVSIVTDRDMTATGVARMISATLVLKPIPSYLQPATSQQTVPTSGG
jgi:hypothetical protein